MGRIGRLRHRRMVRLAVRMLLGGGVQIHCLQCLFAIYWRITQQHFQLGRNGLDSDLMARGCQLLDKLPYSTSLRGQTHWCATAP